MMTSWQRFDHPPAPGSKIIVYAQSDDNKDCWRYLGEWTGDGLIPLGLPRGIPALDARPLLWSHPPRLPRQDLVERARELPVVALMIDRIAA